MAGGVEWVKVDLNRPSALPHFIGQRRRTHCETLAMHTRPRTEQGGGICQFKREDIARTDGGFESQIKSSVRVRVGSAGEVQGAGEFSWTLNCPIITEKCMADHIRGGKAIGEISI